MDGTASDLHFSQIAKGMTRAYTRPMLNSGTRGRLGDGSVARAERKRRRHANPIGWIACTLALELCPLAAAQEVSPQPFPMIEAGMHTASIWQVAADAAGR